MPETRILEEKEAFSIIDNNSGQLVLSDFNCIVIGRPATLLLRTGEIIQTSAVSEWKSYPSNQIITKHSIYYIEHLYR